uniref:Uncharacterized protein n=1 Tax=Romanomermis culicivorax TaxID=13658 RepID=A0A915KVN0_ROMCU
MHGASSRAINMMRQYVARAQVPRSFYQLLRLFVDRSGRIHFLKRTSASLLTQPSLNRHIKSSKEIKSARIFPTKNRLAAFLGRKFKILSPEMKTLTSDGDFNGEQADSIV